MEETIQLARFIVNTFFEDLSLRVIDHAKIHVLDTIGAMLYSSEKEWSVLLFEYARQNAHRGEATVIAKALKTSPAMAALVNGTMAHGFEIDDTHAPSSSHPGSVVIPAALAVGEVTRCSGKEFICAVVLGYEAMCRIGRAVGIDHNLRGFHPTGTNGVFGSAVAAAKLLRLDAKQTACSLGIAGSTAAGIKEFSVRGEMVKRLHAGCASERGIMSAFLARGGFTGPKTVLEGTSGYLKVYSGHPAFSEITRDLGKRYEITCTDLKPYACCRSIQPAIEALEIIRNEHGIRPAEVEAIVVGGSRNLVAQHSGEGRASVMAAQYSMPFSGALSFFRDLRNPDAFDHSALKDRKIIALSKKIKTEVHDDLDKLSGQGRVARVTVKLKDKKIYAATILSAKGHASNPLSRSEVEEKFHRLASRRLTKNKRMAVIAMVEALETVNDIGKLTHMIR